MSTASKDPTPGAVCARCRHEFWKHGHADGRRCPDEAGVFVPRPPKSPNTGHSFTPEQVNWLADVCETLQREPGKQHAALRKLARDRAAGAIAGKVAVMKASSVARKGRAQ